MVSKGESFSPTLSTRTFSNAATHRCPIVADDKLFADPIRYWKSREIEMIAGKTMPFHKHFYNILWWN